jgi:flagellar basal-body rod protein FlgB
MFQGLAVNSEHYMSLLSARQKLVASNIANADTPGYKTQDINFRAAFENALAGDPSSEPSVMEAEGLTTKPDGNNVNIDREARLLAENSMRFSIASNFARAELNSVRTAIQESK